MRAIKGVMLAGVFHHPGATIPADAMTDAMLARLIKAGAVADDGTSAAAAEEAQTAAAPAPEAETAGDDPIAAAAEAAAKKPGGK